MLPFLQSLSANGPLPEDAGSQALPVHAMRILGQGVQVFPLTVASLAVSLTSTRSPLWASHLLDLHNRVASSAALPPGEA